MDFSLGYPQTPIAYFLKYALTIPILKIGIEGAISPLQKAFSFSTLELPHYIDNLKLSIPFGLA